jgi:hypothetical protein
VVTGITWDDDCTLCDDDYCIDGQCAIDESECDTSCLTVNGVPGTCDNAEKKTNCDLKVNKQMIQKTKNKIKKKNNPSSTL